MSLAARRIGRCAPLTPSNVAPPVNGRARPDLRHRAGRRPASVTPRGAVPPVPDDAWSPAPHPMADVTSVAALLAALREVAATVPRALEALDEFGPVRIEEVSTTVRDGDVAYRARFEDPLVLSGKVVAKVIQIWFTPSIAPARRESCR